jgi:hypothetical protein
MENHYCQYLQFFRPSLLLCTVTPKFRWILHASYNCSEMKAHAEQFLVAHLMSVP